MKFSTTVADESAESNVCVGGLVLLTVYAVCVKLVVSYHLYDFCPHLLWLLLLFVPLKLVKMS